MSEPTASPTADGDSTPYIVIYVLFFVMFVFAISYWGAAGWRRRHYEERRLLGVV